MTCAECRARFSAVADEALAADARATVEQHMAGCAECRRDWTRFSATVDLLHAVQRERAPAGFVDRVLTAARPLPWYRRLARGLLVPWTVKLPLEAAAVVMVAGLAVLVFERLPETETSSFGAPMESRSAAPADAAARSGDQQELLARSADADRRKDLEARVYEESSPRAAAPQAPATAAPPSRPDETGVQHSSDARTLFGAKPDVGRSESAPPPTAQQPSQERLMRPRQPLRDQTATPPPALKSVPAAPNAAAATGESVDDVRAKRPDKLAKETERDAALNLTGRGVIAGARERKAEDGAAVSRLARVGVPPNVELRLATTDREAATREIATIVERLGGAMLAPAPDTLEIMVPSRAFAALTGDLSRLGTLRIVQQPSAELPDNIRIALRLTD